MASQMEWSHDFCLSCDRQIAEGGAYCSQACRLADLEKAGNLDSHTNSQLSSSASSSSSSTHGFHLPPAVNFSALRTRSPTRGFDLGSSSPPNCYHPTVFTNNWAHADHSTPTFSSREQQQHRTLSPSSSRSSLSSASSQSTTGISAQAASQLHSYMQSFDQVRDFKRRFVRY